MEQVVFVRLVSRDVPGSHSFPQNILQGSKHPPAAALRRGDPGWCPAERDPLGTIPCTQAAAHPSLLGDSSPAHRPGPACGACPFPRLPASLCLQATWGGCLALETQEGAGDRVVGAPGRRWPEGQVARTGHWPGPQLIMSHPVLPSPVPGLWGQPACLCPDRPRLVLCHRLARGGTDASRVRCVIALDVSGRARPLRAP